MRSLRAFWSRLKAPLLEGPRESDLTAELNAHLQMLTDENLRAGLSAHEARRRARIALGGIESLREDCRDARGAGWLSDFVQDLRYALRNLRQKPGFAAVAILTLALGIGATTVMFTVIDGVLFRPLPWAQPDRLVTLNEWTDKPTQFGNLWAFTYPNFQDCQRGARTLAIAAWAYKGGTVTQPGTPEHVDGFEISSNLFSTLGVSMVRGRAFQPVEDRAGASPVAVISYSLWQHRFAGGIDTIGQTISFEGRDYTVIGVTPAGFRLSQDADIYLPLGQDTAPVLQNRNIHMLHTVARLEPDATLSQAQAELASIGRGLAARYPESNTGRTMIAQPLRPEVGDVRSTLWLLLGAVSLVLLIACVNVASLFLARAVSREREIAMRVALGASRGRLARQCLTESGVLAICGGALGLLLAAVSVRPFTIFWPGSLPRAEAVHLDARVFLFALGASLLSGLLFGLAPALRAPARDLESSLRAGGRAVVGASRRLHGSFVISEIALAMVLLVSAGMLGRTVLRLSTVDPGLNIRNMLVARAALAPGLGSDAGKLRAAWNDLVVRLGQVPGVESVTMVDTVPMREGNNPLGYSTTAALPPPDQQPLALATSVTPGYLDVMGIALRSGRFFTDQDRLGSEPVVVIDDVLARHAFGGDQPIGKNIWFPAMAPGPVRIVGVVGHVRYWGLAGDDQAQIRAQVYYPFAQVPDPLVRRWSDLMSIAVRTRVEPLSLLESLRRQLTGGEVLYEERTMEQLAAASLARQRFLLLLFGTFAALALILASIGIYGVLAYLTSQRVPEVGVRMALGASAHDVVQLVLRQSFVMIAAGIALGVAGALAAGRVLDRLVSGMHSDEPLAFAAMASILLAAALFASFLPARRASRIDPMNALRQE